MAEELEMPWAVGKAEAAQQYLARCSGELNAVLLGAKSFEQASESVKKFTDDLSDHFKLAPHERAQFSVEVVSNFDGKTAAKLL